MIDMSVACIDAVGTRVSQATPVFDRFHVQRPVQSAFDDLHRAEVRALDNGDEREISSSRAARV